MFILVNHLPFSESPDQNMGPMKSGNQKEREEIIISYFLSNLSGQR
jgi:hypothetical protein